MLTQLVTGHFLCVYPVYQDFSASDLIETHQQVDQRGFSGSGRSDDGDLLTGLYPEAYICHQKFIRIISELNVFKLHSAVTGGRNQSVLSIRDFLLCIKKREDTLTRGCGCGKLAGHLSEGDKGLLEGFRILQT